MCFYLIKLILGIKNTIAINNKPTINTPIYFNTENTLDLTVFLSFIEGSFSINVIEYCPTLTLKIDLITIKKVRKPVSFQESKQRRLKLKTFSLKLFLFNLT